MSKKKNQTKKQKKQESFEQIMEKQNEKRINKHAEIISHPFKYGKYNKKQYQSYAMANKDLLLNGTGNMSRKQCFQMLFRLVSNLSPLKKTVLSLGIAIFLLCTIISFL